MHMKIGLLFFYCLLAAGSVAGQGTPAAVCPQAELTIKRPDGIYVDDRYPLSWKSGMTLAISTKTGQEEVMVVLFLSEQKKTSQTTPGPYHPLFDLQLVLPITQVKTGTSIPFILNWGETFTQDHALAKYRYLKGIKGTQPLYMTLWSNWAGHVRGVSEGEVTFTSVTDRMVCGYFKVRVFEDTAAFGTDALETGKNAMTIATTSFSAPRLPLVEATDRIEAYQSKP